MSAPVSLSIPWILPLASEQASLEWVGGKGANLARLARAGLAVPSGFLVTTKSYHAFVRANSLTERIQEIVQSIPAHNLTGLEQAAESIRALFGAGTLPASLAGELRLGYAQYTHGSVAVRSSATAEDLPEMSFAGQQDTYLNITSEAQLLRAVVNCWASLWTARALGYRLRNNVSNASIALAVVVQDMVESQASGVLFTANPLTGLRTETVIDAAFGLGEALVSGQVEPDHYTIQQAKGQILNKTLGAKSVSIHSRPEGGTQISRQERQAVQALPDEQILALAAIGQQIETLYAFPQDIEWAWANGQLYILQARPITSLFPLPAGLPAKPAKAFISFGAVQGLLAPITPVGSDAIQALFAAGAHMFGFNVTSQTQTALIRAGERLWINVTPILANTTGRRIIPVVLSMVEPTVRQAIDQIKDEPDFQPAQRGISLESRLRLVRFFLPVAGNLLLNLLAPGRRRAYIVQQGEVLLHLMARHCASIQGDRWQKLALLANLLPELAEEFLSKAFRLFVSVIAAGMASWNFLNKLSAGTTSATPEAETSLNDLVLQVTRGMPYNPTTEMDLEIWEMARAIKSDRAALPVFENSTASQLASIYLAGGLPVSSQGLVKIFLDKYGGRGLAEIDLGRTRWATDPTHLFEMLGSFLQISDESRAPDVVFAAGAEAAGQAVQELVRRVSSQPGGWIKAGLIRFFAGRARQLMGARENPKFFAVRMMFILQQALLHTGQEFVRAGELKSPDDLFYLSFAEMSQFANHQPADWQGLIAERRASFERERLRRQIPRLLLSDGRTFYEGMAASAADPDGIIGSPVSPGVIEGLVRVVLDPRQAGLHPGEILVCPGTDPSWTPLFLSAGGLIMEVGGMMTHGAVVAREYGIPAIVGVHQATLRLKTGQRIRMDGSSGQIQIRD